MPAADDFRTEAGTVIPDRLAPALFLLGELAAVRDKFPGTDLARVITAIEAAAARRNGTPRGTSPAASPPNGAPSVSTKAAAEHLGISIRGVRNAIARGTLPAAYTEGRWTITPADLDLYAQTRSRPTP